MTELLSATAVSIRNLLVPTDFSPSAQVALHVARAVAEQHQAKLYVAHVLTPVPVPPVPVEGMVNLHDFDLVTAEREMDRIACELRSAEIQHEVVMREGLLWEELSALIAERKVDLLVTGTHGRGGLEKFLLGSVAEEIFRRAACPVLTVGPYVDEALAVRCRLERILFPTDLSAHSLHALPYAVEFAQEQNSELTLLHVAKPENASPHLRALVMQEQSQRLRWLTSGRPLPGRVRFEVEFGEPAEVILRIAALLAADLIVLGVHQTAALASHVPWSVASRVVRAARCPVLTVCQPQ